MDAKQETVRAMKLRDCEPSDIPAVAAIYGREVENGTASFELTPPGEAEMLARRAALVAGRYPYLVAEIDEAVAGYAYAGPYRARPAYLSTLENSVYVDPRFRGRGVARRLLAALVEAGAARGFRQMIAVIGDSANAGSIGVHLKTGFTLIGTHPSVGLKFGRWLDTVMMQRALGEAATTVPGD